MWEVIETSTIRKERMRCSKCGFTRIFIDGHSGQYNYCPQCGAKQTEPQTDKWSHECIGCGNNDTCEFAFTDAVKICRYINEPQTDCAWGRDDDVETD